MKVTLEIELSESQVAQLLSNSIERVMNNAIYVGANGELAFRKQVARERASTLWQDCEELKPLVCEIWSGLSEATRKELYRG